MKAYAKGALLGIALIGLAACGGGDKKDDGGDKAAGGGDKPAANEGDGGGDAVAYDASAHKGSLTGVVKFGGATIPAAVALNVSSDEVCSGAWKGKTAVDQMFQVNADGTMPNVFIYPAKGGPQADYTGYTPATDFVVTQKDCYYVPHVFGVMVGQDFKVTNDDQTMHNVNVSPKRNEGANKGQPPGASDTFSFSKKEGAIPFTCDVHSWMSAKAWVMDHPFFATTDAEGKFSITGLPDGEYTFKAWHENEDFGKAEFKVTIAGGEVSETVTLK